MKFFLLVLITFFYISTAQSCEPYDAARQIYEAPVTKRLLRKVSKRLSAHCEIPYWESSTHSIEVNYVEADERRSSGTVKRTFQATAMCTRRDQSIFEKEFYGSVKIRFRRATYQSEQRRCDLPTTEKVVEIQIKEKR
ncbi:MAG TPA: hypothetical protein VNJ01_18140 [Bacteriovoracaceae bacterium]|nr:hypothetical protein [Bacteriovoracaceae bacterium]